MYRDDVCAVCGASLPPDHFYCRDHGATVDDRLHELGAMLGRVVEDLPLLVTLLDGIAQETWDYLAEDEPDAPLWPPSPRVDVRVHADDVDVDVDAEPGRVRIRLDAPLAQVLAAVADGLSAVDGGRLATACRAAEGANATH